MQTTIQYIHSIAISSSNALHQSQINRIEDIHINVKISYQGARVTKMKISVIQNESQSYHNETICVFVWIQGRTLIGTVEALQSCKRSLRD